GWECVRYGSACGGMWPRASTQSREGRSPRDDPADDRDRKSEADQRHPPFAGLHWPGAWIQPRSAGEHRLGKVLTAKPVEDDGCNVQDDEAEDDVEPGFVQVARLVGRVAADQPGQGAEIKPVLILRDEAETSLNYEHAEQGKHAQRPQGRVSDPPPAAAQIVAHRRRPANESGEPRRRAANEAPEQPEDQQGQDGAARPDVPVSVVITDRPPA